MAYIVEADLSERLSPAQLVQLTDDEKTGQVDSAKIALVLARAEDEVNGYLATRYAVPVLPVPGLVKALALDVAVYRLYLRRQRVPDEIRTSYEDGLKKLEQIAKGTITLGVDPPPSSSTSSSQGEVMTPDRIFSRDTLSNF